MVFSVAAIVWAMFVCAAGVWVAGVVGAVVFAVPCPAVMLFVAGRLLSCDLLLAVWLFSVRELPTNFITTEAESNSTNDMIPKLRIQR